MLSMMNNDQVIGLLMNYYNFCEYLNIIIENYLVISFYFLKCLNIFATSLIAFHFTY